MYSSEHAEPVEYDNPIEIADGVYWVGFWDEHSRLHCNPYLIIDGQEAVLITVHRHLVEHPAPDEAYTTAEIAERHLRHAPQQAMEYFRAVTIDTGILPRPPPGDRHVGVADFIEQPV